MLLILIKFYRVLMDLEANTADRGKTFSSHTLKQMIFETNDFEGVERFKIFNENREEAFALVTGMPVATTDLT